jgi:hypothetical protein
LQLNDWHALAGLIHKAGIELLIRRFNATSAEVIQQLTAKTE